MKEGNYFRRCHKCDGVIEADHQEKHICLCLFCEYPLAPFHHVDEKFSPVMSENTLRPVLSSEEYNPVHGLSAFWDNLGEHNE